MPSLLKTKLPIAAVLLFSMFVFSCSKSDFEVHIEGTYLGRMSVDDTTYNDYYVHIDKLSSDKIRVYYASSPMLPYFELPLKRIGNTFQSNDKSITLKYSGVTELVEFNRDSSIIFAGAKVE